MGWRQKPTFNEDLHTVSWAIEAQDSNGGRVANFVALKLGRYGIERIVWVVDPSKIGDKSDLLLAINNHQFDTGARYADYVAGTEHEWTYGVAGLVAGALGVKLLKGAVVALSIVEEICVPC